MRNLILMFLIFVLSPVYASTAVGVVSQIRASESTDLVIFKLTGEVEDAPRCNETGSYTFRLGSPGGQAVLELLRLSMLEKMAVKVVGLNTCSRGYDSEGIHDITLG